MCAASPARGVDTSSGAITRDPTRPDPVDGQCREPQRAESRRWTDTKPGAGVVNAGREVAGAGERYVSGGPAARPPPPAAPA